MPEYSERHTVLLPHEEEESKKAAKYRSLMDEIIAEAEQLRVNIEMAEATRGSEYEDPQVSGQLDALLTKFADTIRLLPKEHALRRQYAIQEEAAKEIMFGGLRKRLNQEHKTLPVVPEAGPGTQPGVSKKKTGATIPYFDVAELVPEELRQPPPEKKPQAESRAGAQEMNPDAYRDAVTEIGDDVLSVAYAFEGMNQKRDPEMVERLLQRLMQDQEKLYHLDKMAGYPKSAKRRAVEELIIELGGQWGHESGVQGDAETERTAVGASWMPRVPVPPYRARLAVAGAMGSAQSPSRVPASDNQPDERSRIASLEEALGAFMADYKRIIGEHNALIKQLTERVKERKLKALRESLKT